MKKSLFSNKLLVAIDIGTTKICVLVAHPLADNTLEIVGIGKSPSHGLAKGVVVDVGKTVHSIKNAVREAELMAGCSIESAVIGISGAHIQSRTSQGMISIKKRTVQDYDVKEVINSARIIDIPEGQQMLHALPQFFTLDAKERVLDPIGMYAMRLEAQVHIITGSVASVQNLVNCCKMAGVAIEDIVLEQLASGAAVLSPDECQLGVAMLDIGGGTSDFAIYHNDAIRHTMVLPVAGNHFTTDLAIGLHTTIGEAERIKKEYGCANLQLFKEDKPITITQLDGSTNKVILKEEIATIVHARAEEIIQIITKEIDRFDMRPFIPSGLVLTGGGSLLNGITNVAQKISKMPVRIGRPYVHESATPIINNPMYATGYGLLLHTLKKHSSPLIHMQGTMLGDIVSRMKLWVSDFF